MIVFDSCCCCIPLRVGTLIIGYVNLVSSIILTIVTIMGLSAGIALSYSGVDDDGVGAAVTAISAVLLVFMVVFLAFTIVLLVGVHQEKPNHVKAYLIYTLVFTIAYLILFIAGFAVGPVSVADIIERLIEIFFNVYFLLVVRSHYVRMLDNRFVPA